MKVCRENPNVFKIGQKYRDTLREDLNTFYPPPPPDDIKSNEMVSGFC